MKKFIYFYHDFFGRRGGGFSSSYMWNIHKVPLSLFYVLGENCIIIVAGANLKMTPSIVEQAEGVIRSASVVVCQGEITPAATLTALRLARKHKGDFNYD